MLLKLCFLQVFRQSNNSCQQIMGFYLFNNIDSSMEIRPEENGVNDMPRKKCNKVIMRACIHLKKTILSLLIQLPTSAFQGRFICVVDEPESYGSKTADGKAIVRNLGSCKKAIKGQKPKPAPKVLYHICSCNQ